MVKDNIMNQDVAMKLQEDQDMASKEVGTMKKVSSVFDINKASEMSTQEMNYDATPRVFEYGLC